MEKDNTNGEDYETFICKIIFSFAKSCAIYLNQLNSDYLNQLDSDVDIKFLKNVSLILKNINKGKIEGVSDQDALCVLINTLVSLTRMLYAAINELQILEEMAEGSLKVNKQPLCAYGDNSNDN